MIISTGLFDKNGVPIFDGDVVFCDHDHKSFGNFLAFGKDCDESIVSFDGKDWCINILYDLHLVPISVEDCKFLTVIGNYFEEPDILKEEWDYD